MKGELAKTFANLEDETMIQIVKSAIDDGTDFQDILSACQDAMSEVGRKFEEGTYFLPELIVAGHIFKQVNELIKPLFGEGKENIKKGKVVVGTVAGDVHSIGKDIVVGLLEANNFEVIDLGIDQPKESFISALKETGATVLGLSGLLTVAFESMKDIVEALKSEGLKDKVKVIIGGGPIDQGICEFVGADSWVINAQSAVTFCQDNT